MLLLLLLLWLSAAGAFRCPTGFYVIQGHCQKLLYTGRHNFYDAQLVCAELATRFGLESGSVRLGVVANKSMAGVLGQVLTAELRFFVAPTQRNEATFRARSVWTGLRRHADGSFGWETGAGAHGDYVRKWHEVRPPPAASKRCLYLLFTEIGQHEHPIAVDRYTPADCTDKSPSITLCEYFPAKAVLDARNAGY